MIDRRGGRVGVSLAGGDDLVAGVFHLLDLRDVLLADAEVVEAVEGAEGGGDGVVGEEEERADDAQELGALPGGGVDAAAVGIEAADLGVCPGDGEDEDAHRADEPEAGAAGDEEGEAEDVEAAGAPVAEEESAGLEPT